MEGCAKNHEDYAVSWENRRVPSPSFDEKRRRLPYERSAAGAVSLEMDTLLGRSCDVTVVAPREDSHGS